MIVSHSFYFFVVFMATKAFLLNNKKQNKIRQKRHTLVTLTSNEHLGKHSFHRIFLVSICFLFLHLFGNFLASSSQVCAELRGKALLRHWLC